MATSTVTSHPASPPAHAPRPLLLGLFALAGVALAIVELALAIPKDGNDIQIALLLWITLPYIAAGPILVASPRQSARAADGRGRLRDRTAALTARRRPYAHHDRRDLPHPAGRDLRARVPGLPGRD
jgi:hypothetical protein